ncbi:MAG: PfkB family carbohydrate kinase [Bryobacteraceae bacterium]
MNEHLDVVMLGFCSWDYLGVVPRIPLDDKVRMAGYLEQGGGPAATAAVASARLGARTGFASVVGDDARGHLILEEFEHEGVDTAACEVQPGAVSPAGFCWVDQPTGQRSIAWYPGTTVDLSPAAEPDRLLRGAKVLHLDGHFPSAAMVVTDRVRASGGIVSLDAGTYREHMLQLIDLSHVVIASEGFARDMIGRDDPEAAIQAIAARGPGIAMVTMGSRGVVCLTSGQVLRRPAFTVDAVDTTGAGDVFHGAFCVGLLEGWDVERSIEFASAAAALKCTCLGGRTGIPRRSEVLRFLDSKRNSK